MKTTVETLDNNQANVSVTVPSADFDEAIDKAFQKLAREVKIPGFRPGKAPRAILEKQFGSQVARNQAIEDAVPEYMVDAIKSESLDVIAYITDPRTNVTDGQEEGDLTFEATVELRPEAVISGYDSLSVSLEELDVDERSVDDQVEQLRKRFAEMVDSADPLSTDSYATIDITGSENGEPLGGLTATDFLYEVGSGSLVQELDNELLGKKTGDIIEFSVDLPETAGEMAGKKIDFKVLIKDTKARVLPELTDEWVKEVTEFDSVPALREDLERRLGLVARMRARLTIREKVLEALADQVDLDVPETLVNQQIRRRLEDMSKELADRGMDLTSWLEAMGKTPEELFEELKEPATQSARADLALRAVIKAEAIEASEADVDAEVENLAAQLKQKPAKVRRDLERNGVLEALRFDLAMGKALQTCVDSAKVTDGAGNPVDLTEPTIEDDNKES